jgi:hypothetical protein
MEKTARALEAERKKLQLMNQTEDDVREEISSNLEKYTENITGDFLPDANIQKIWTSERIRHLVEGIRIMRDYRDHEGEVDATELTECHFKHFEKIISILCFISWKQWERFGTIFLVTDDEKGEQFTRSDKQLPFDHNVLEKQDFLKHHYAGKFVEEQPKFSPVLIKEGSKNQFDKGAILPLYRKKLVKAGGYGQVYNVVVARQSYEGRAPGKPRNEVSAKKIFLHTEHCANEKIGRVPGGTQRDQIPKV